jgi:Tfp pilus assembly pilus retraction ATPase PilT
VAAFEVLKVSARAHQYIESAGLVGQSLLQLMKDGEAEGMRHFDGEIAKLVSTGVVDAEVALAYATEPEELQAALAR